MSGHWFQLRFLFRASLFFASISTLNCQEGNADDQFQPDNGYCDLETELAKIIDIKERISFLEYSIRTRIGGDLKVTPKIVNGGGVTFVRWGRTICPENETELVYHGIVAGPKYSDKGGGSEYICLAMPVGPYAYDDAIHEWSSSLSGTEYEIDDNRARDLYGRKMLNHNVPCAVCRSKTRISVLMLPGRSACFDSWITEYTGHLMSAYVKHNQRTNYICVDRDPERITGKGANEDGSLLYPVEVSCGFLPCPPFVNGREVGCAVCTK
ncbi:hypothetical protein ScPMuIL_000679 [Solemya velum]